MKSLGLWNERDDDRPVTRHRTWEYHRERDGAKLQAHRLNYYGGAPCRYGMNSGRACGKTYEHKHNWQTPKKGPKRKGFQPLILNSVDSDGSEPIVIVEGEVTAESVQRAGFTAATAIGGGESMHIADWSVVAGRDVVIWPDTQPEGKVAMLKVVRRLVTNGWCAEPLEVDVSDMRELSGRRKDSLDADDIMDTAVIRAKIEGATPYEMPDGFKEGAPGSSTIPFNEEEARVLRAQQELELCPLDAHHGKQSVVQALIDLAGHKVAFARGKVYYYKESTRRWHDKETARSWLQTEVGIVDKCLKHAGALESYADSKPNLISDQSLYPFLDEKGNLKVLQPDLKWRDANADDGILDMKSDVADMKLLTISDDVMRSGLDGAFMDNPVFRFATERLGFDEDTYHSAYCGLLRKGMFGEAPREIMLFRGASNSGKGTLVIAAQRVFGPYGYTLPSSDFNNFTSHFLIGRKLGVINEAAPNMRDLNMAVGATGRDPLNGEAKGGDGYQAVFYGILIIAGVHGLRNADTSTGLANRIRVFQTTKINTTDPELLAKLQAESDDAIENGVLGLFFDILRSTPPPTHNLVDMPSQVQAWSTDQIIDADEIVNFVASNYKRSVGGEVTAASVKLAMHDNHSRSGDMQAARRVMRYKGEAFKSAFDKLGYAIKDPSSRKPVFLDCEYVEPETEGEVNWGDSQGYASEAARNPAPTITRRPEPQACDICDGCGDGCDCECHG